MPRNIQKPPDGSQPKCVFCNSFEDNELKFGKIYQHDGITTHYYCLLLSSNMQQKGSDEEGILGFLAVDILDELRRGKRLVCTYCKKNGATLGCCNAKCKKIFHLPCGLKSGSLHQFFGEFRSYCINHRPKQKIDDRIRAQVSEQSLCYICYDSVDRNNMFETLWAPCCKKNAWFHRDCVQQLAMSAGYFFKCPLCNNKKEFQKAMLDNGIFIPCQDASWELVPNAFQELLYRHNRCDAASCSCPKGRRHTSSNPKWELILCRTCGSQGIHVLCGRLKWSNATWDCSECTSILQRTGNAPDDTETRNSSNSNDSHSNGLDSASDSDVSVGMETPPDPSTWSTDSQPNPPEGTTFRPGPRSYKAKQKDALGQQPALASSDTVNAGSGSTSQGSPRTEFGALMEHTEYQNYAEGQQSAENYAIGEYMHLDHSEDPRSAPTPMSYDDDDDDDSDSSTPPPRGSRSEEDVVLLDSDEDIVPERMTGSLLEHVLTRSNVLTTNSGQAIPVHSVPSSLPSDLRLVGDVRLHTETRREEPTESTTSRPAPSIPVSRSPPIPVRIPSPKPVRRPSPIPIRRSSPVPVNKPPSMSISRPASRSLPAPVDRPTPMPTTNSTQISPNRCTPMSTGGPTSIAHIIVGPSSDPMIIGNIQLPASSIPYALPTSGVPPNPPSNPQPIPVRPPPAPSVEAIIYQPPSDPIMNIRISNVTSLPPELFAEAPAPPEEPPAPPQSQDVIDVESDNEEISYHLSMMHPQQPISAQILNSQVPPEIGRDIQSFVNDAVRADSKRRRVDDGSGFNAISRIYQQPNGAYAVNGGFCLQNAALVNVMGKEYVLPLDNPPMVRTNGIWRPEYDGDAGTIPAGERYRRYNGRSSARARTVEVPRGTKSSTHRKRFPNERIRAAVPHAAGSRTSTTTVPTIRPTASARRPTPTRTPTRKPAAGNSARLKGDFLLKNLRFHVTGEHTMKMTVIDMYTVDVTLDHVKRDVKRPKPGPKCSKKRITGSSLVRRSPSIPDKKSNPESSSPRNPKFELAAPKFTRSPKHAERDAKENLAPSTTSHPVNYQSPVERSTKRLRADATPRPPDAGTSRDGLREISQALANQRRAAQIQKAEPKKLFDELTRDLRVSIDLRKIQPLLLSKPELFVKDRKSLPGRLTKFPSLSDIKSASEKCASVRRCKSMESLPSSNLSSICINLSSSNYLFRARGKKRKLRSVDKHNCVR